MYGQEEFERIHLMFIYTINTLITVGTFISIYKFQKITKKPFIDDVKLLFKLSKISYLFKK